MCGISCCVALGGSSTKLTRSELQQQLNSSLEIIKHRGPDSRGSWISEDSRVALGHVRLSINDLSESGSQPFHSPDGNVHAVINGELYGHEEIRAQLQSRHDFNYQFQGTSDCEIVIALYQYYGLSFLDHLRGEFSLCLWDANEQLFLAARDRYGIKPLFYTVDHAGRLLVGAEIKAFLPMGWKAEWDVRSIKDGGWNFDDRTHFKGVRKIRPGHYLLCKSYDREFEQRVYWDMTYPDKNLKETRSEEEMIQGVREHLVQAVRLRLRADVPVGVYLSGGIDSSAIAGIMTHLVREQGERIGNDKETDRINCFTIAFDEDSGFDESAIAQRTADFLDIKLHKKHMSEAELASRFEAATWHSEHTNADLNYIGKFALSELPRQLGFKVVLTGEGSDEHFAGYPMYLPDFLREPDPSWPSASQVPESQRAHLAAQKDSEAEQYYNSIGANGSIRSDPSSIICRRALNNISTPASMTAFSPTSVLASWTDALGSSNQQTTIANSISGTTRTSISHAWHPLHSAMYIWSKGHLANLFLSCLGDRTEMAHSLEARTPFLDHVLTTYVNHLPPSLKIAYSTPPSSSSSSSSPSASHEPSSAEHTFTEKSILRHAMQPFITDEIFSRKKHPYSAPIRYAKGGPLHVLLKGLITDDAVAALGFVDGDVARDSVERAFDDDDDDDDEADGGQKMAMGSRNAAMRNCFMLAQWIVLGRRFGVKKAVVDDW